jgi:hypothetical protein
MSSPVPHARAVRLWADERPNSLQLRGTDQPIETGHDDYQKDETASDQKPGRGPCPILGETSGPILWARRFNARWHREISKL